MKSVLLAALLALSTSSPNVYVCDSPSAYAYHRSTSCAGQNKYSRHISNVSLSEAEQAGRHPCHKCYSTTSRW